MRITKLHLLIIFLGIAVVSLGAYFWKVKYDEKMERDEKMKAELEMRKKADEFAAMKKVDETQAAQSPEKKEETPLTYTVQKGDTLWSIAKKKEHFGLGHRWYDIWKANEDKIEDFDALVAGQVLTIPLDKTDGHPWPKTADEKKEKILSKERSKKSSSVTKESEVPPEEVPSN